MTVSLCSLLCYDVVIENNKFDEWVMVGNDEKACMVENR